MTNNELINLSAFFRGLLDAHFSKESGVNLSNKVFYALRKCARLITPIVEENESIISDWQELFKEIEKIDEAKLQSDKKYVKDINDKFKKFVNLPENADIQKVFLAAESTVELFKISVNDLDECIIPISDSEFLEKYIV